MKTAANVQSGARLSHSDTPRFRASVLSDQFNASARRARGTLQTSWPLRAKEANTRLVNPS
jgi:hypothetical protein